MPPQACLVGAIVCAVVLALASAALLVWWILPRKRKSAEYEVYCTKCGSADVQHAVWMQSNTGEVVDDFGSFNEPDSSWCNACESHATLVTRLRG